MATVGRRKGAAWERQFAKLLSNWWTNGQDSFVFSRRSGSGGSRRDLNGFSGCCGDIQADQETGKLLTDSIAIELKSYRCLGGELWKWVCGESLVSKFWEQAQRAAFNRDPILVMKSNYRQSLVICRRWSCLGLYILEHCPRSQYVSIKDELILFPLSVWFGLPSTELRKHLT